MRCPNCGAEVTSRFCPDCGTDLQQQQSSQQPPIMQQPESQKNSYYNSPPIPGFSIKQQEPPPLRKKNSKWGIFAFILAFLGPLALVAVILAIVDLLMDKNKTYKHELSIAALVISGILLFALSRSGSGSRKESSDDNPKSTVEVAKESVADASSSDSSSEVQEQQQSEETVKETKEETKTEGPLTVGIGEVFGNKTITGVVTYVDLDYKDYNDVWTKVDEGYKAIYVKIKVTNISEKSNYVSVGDFNCYADNISTNAEMVAGENEDYNANIDAGRSALLGALYIVPENAVNIELEYRPIGERADRQIIVLADENTTETKLSAEGDVAETKAESNDDVKVIGIGEEFGNKTITGVVTEVDLDSKQYNEYWTTVEPDQKAIYIKIKVTNLSDESNYVSVGDFRCYVDDLITDAELVSEGNEDYNANIDPGRSAILGALYIVPKDTESIELEYNPIGESADRVIIKIQ